MIASGKSFSPPPESVTSAPVQAAEWQPSHPATGSVVAVRGVTLGAELPGTVREIDFDSGRLGQARRRAGPARHLDRGGAAGGGPGRRHAGPAGPGAGPQPAAGGGQHAGRPGGGRGASRAGRRRGGRAGGHHRQEDHPRPVRRAHRHPPGRARAGGDPGHPGGVAPVGRPDLRRLLAAAAGPVHAEGGPAGAAAQRHLSGHDLGRAARHHQPRDRPGHAQRAAPRHLRQRRRPAAAGDVRQRRGPLRRAAAGAAGPGHRRPLRALRRLGLRAGAARRRRASRPARWPGSASCGSASGAATWWRWSPD